MVFGHKAADNILPWLRMKFSQKILIHNVFLGHPQNIKRRYTLEHARNNVETFRAIMTLLGVDIPPLGGHVQLRFLMTKNHMLEMCVCVDEFVDSVVLEAVQQRTDKVKIARVAKVEEMIEKRKEMQAAAAAAAAVAAVAAAAIKMEMQAAELSCLCSHVGCVKTKHARGVCEIMARGAATMDANKMSMLENSAKGMIS